MDHSSFQSPGLSHVAVPSAVVQYFLPVSSSIHGAIFGSVHVAYINGVFDSYSSKREKNNVTSEREREREIDGEHEHKE